MADATARIGARWDEIVAIEGFTGDAGESALARLLAVYSDTARHYHGAAHIAALLALSAAHRGALRDPVAVDLAILFHDAVYVPARNDNEARSALLAHHELTALGLPADRIETIARYIRATAHTTVATDETHADSDLDHLLDFDLSILAAEPVDYDAYAAAIRREYAIQSRRRLCAGPRTRPAQPACCTPALSPAAARRCLGAARESQSRARDRNARERRRQWCAATRLRQLAVTSPRAA